MPWLSVKLLALCLLSLSSHAQLITPYRHGCCFNETDHEAGDVVAVFKESCLKLVCAVEQSPFRGEILAVQIPPEECSGTPCSNCYDTSCVDELGLIRSQDSSWMPNECSKCECGDGQRTQCLPVPVSCEPQPDPACKKIEGPCCPAWECILERCVDENGQIREIDEEWGSSPCRRHICTRSGIETLLVACFQFPAVNASCELFTPEGECCPDIRCGCVDNQGVLRKINEQWADKDPCITNTCHPEGIIQIAIFCAFPPVNETCQLFTPEGQCCPELRCGCVDEDGNIRALGEEWGSPCIRHFCTSSEIFTRIYDCFPFPPVNASCQIITTEDKCCPELRCGCLDDQGVFRRIGEQWHDQSPCTTNTCTPEGRIIQFAIGCLIPSVNETCELFTPEGQCCPEVRCGCVDEDGNIRAIGEEWGSPCIRHFCTSSRIFTRIEDCFPFPPVNASCQIITPEDKCCPELKCGCVDNEGNVREVGEEWREACSEFTCTANGIIELAKICPSLTLNATCHSFIPKGQCCPVARCGCMEYGEFHKLYTIWQPEPCMYHTCTEKGIVRDLRICRLPPKPNSFCYEVTNEGKCCPEWNCSELCKDKDGEYRSLGETWGGPCEHNLCTEEGIVTALVDCLPLAPHNSSCQIYTPEDECCPKVICGFCIDRKGGIHAINGTWTESCLALTCTPSGTVASTVICQPPLEVNKTCQLVTLEGQCCPELRCGCADEEGLFREIGSEWRPYPCTSHVCSERGILKSTRVCKLGPKPDPVCTEVTQEGECCPEWDCGLTSHCFYEGKSYKIGEEFYDPLDPCNRRYCLEDGILKVLLNCTYNRPNPWCVAKRPEGECCPTFICSGCADVQGGYIPLGTQWETDPCTSHECTVNGEVTTKKNCTKEPQPNLLCRLKTPAGKCCPSWECPDSDPCKVSVYATNGTKLDNACAPPPEAPHPNCELIVPNGGCCPQWECGTDCRLVRCGLTEKPADNCRLYTPRLGCCPKWNCSYCIEGERSYSVGTAWYPDPCTKNKCTPNGIVSEQPPCPETDPPFQSCRLELVDGGCCPRWKCNCLDKDGNSHAMGSSWEEDCMAQECAHNGVIIESPVNCFLNEPPHFNCIPFTPRGDCCPKWTCGPNCAAVLCAGPPHENCVADPLLPLSCCSTYTCLPGAQPTCEIGEQWEQNCLTYNCTSQGIEVHSTRCEVNPPPNDNCELVLNDGSCCLEWDCGVRAVFPEEAELIIPIPA